MPAGRLRVGRAKVAACIGLDPDTTEESHTQQREATRRGPHYGRLDRAEPLANPARMNEGGCVMRTPRLALAGTVTLALLGGSSGLVLAQDVEPIGPLEPDGPSLFTMRQVSVEEVPWPEATTRPDGSVQWQGPADAWVGESSDPRLSGTYTLYGNGQAWPVDEKGMAMATVISGSVRIENEGGTWTGTPTRRAGHPSRECRRVRPRQRRRARRRPASYEGLPGLRLLPGTSRRRRPRTCRPPPRRR